ncbi:Translation elongation/initiation factor/Ribosomal beta-barrel [Penicillium taxi]|uniref:Translation elongation/initiation factor/Ribosomal beta-barrel n=1 Tax=Penicillium taxi TaxID=168475 RepID=UPI002544F3EC|nr:Translation elongation/initiation factor/Ribosomal beta-barrel [Penicillium taxi]KAJ5902427.1 Translation elongation/initiation factor/Ribosomal beta-barrel [Penicillium taxi]
MEDLYDEFGNYIGDAESEDEQHEATQVPQVNFESDEEDEESVNDQQLMEIDDGPSNAVILHEDKQYYPSAQQVYGVDVETLVEEEDAQPLSEPIIAPVQQKKFTIQETELPEVYFSRQFMSDMLNHPDQTRNVALMGHLHHGKTAFMDMLVQQTHDLSERLERQTGKRRDQQLRYTDVSLLERERGLSIKAAPMTLVLPASNRKSHLINVIDTPGHVNFVDEVAASLRLVDGVVLVVDVVEGVQPNTENIIKHAVIEDIPLTLILNKVDRLILDLKLPPNDAYFKLKHVIEEVNTVIENALPGQGEQRRLSPEKGNVAFASSSMNWCFTLQSWALKYSETYPKLDSCEFADRLWGDIFYNPRSRKFTRKAMEENSKRGFVKFVLEPIYKLYSHAISESPNDLEITLASVGIHLKPSQLKSGAKELLSMVCSEFFGAPTGFVDMIIQHIPSPVEGAQRFSEHYYTGPLDSKIAASMVACDQDGPLVIHITKLFSSQDAQTFNAFGRVLSGTARPGQQVRVLGEGYSPDDEEDMVIATISDTYIAETAYNVPTDGVPAGNLILLGGVDNSIVKTATLVPLKLEDDEDAFIFRPIMHMTESVFKVAVEPVNPSELPKMLDGLRKIGKSYPLITTKVEESGEHIILGTGELYMDCVLHDLRRLYADMQIKVSDPVTRFCETVVETSSQVCISTTPNKKNMITMRAESLDDAIAQDIESGKVNIKDPIRKVARYFEETHDWDKLAARSIWAFGPDEMSPNILQDDTLPSQVDKKVLGSVRDSITQGFCWGTREGPLCEEPIRNTRFKLTDVTLAEQAIYRGGGQIIPTARRAVYSSFLTAAPRLMEPIYACTVTGPSDTVAAVYTTLSRRRGHVLSDGPIAGTPLYTVRGLIPVIDSFGFETDVRIFTRGHSMVSLEFDKWSVVPGDPLDQTIELRPLEIATAMATARDFMLKTRRRKGLAEDVSINKFLESMPEI